MQYVGPELQTKRKLNRIHAWCERYCEQWGLNTCNFIINVVCCKLILKLQGNPWNTWGEHT